jgi:hypothetical protein
VVAESPLVSADVSVDAAVVTSVALAPVAVDSVAVAASSSPQPPSARRSAAPQRQAPERRRLGRAFVRGFGRGLRSDIR